MEGTEAEGSAPEGSAGSGAKGTVIAKRKLWSKQQFPEGTVGAASYELTHLKAAQEWACPCKDRQSCISSARVGILELYEHRKHFRTTAAQHGGLRDANRLQLQAHFDGSSKSFTRSFVVGRCGDCCAPSAALANGISFATFASGRADVTKERTWHQGRCELRSKQQSAERAHLEAYIREVRGTMEGPKGGSQPNDKYHLPKAAIRKRWETYVLTRTGVSLCPLPRSCHLDTTLPHLYVLTRTRSALPLVPSRDYTPCRLSCKGM